MRRRVLRLLLLILAWPPLALGAGASPPGATAGDIPYARDLAADARDMKARRAVLLALYSQADCRWCERAKAEYLIPLQNDPAWQGRVLVRQIALDRADALVDFAGRRTSQQDFARAEGVRVTPTLVVYGPEGGRLAEPIVGFRLADFYASYIERALQEALAKSGRTTR